MQEFAKIRMTGSAAYSLCLVASGSADVYAERSIMAWDVAAGVAVALGAGAKLLTPERLGGEPLDVVVSAASLADEVSGIISA
jgi:myo-inositol-1(or 4)-monophosphatase